MSPPSKQPVNTKDDDIESDWWIQLDAWLETPKGREWLADREEREALRA